MTTHHSTCHECERRRQEAADEAFADMVVLAHYHPEWFMFGDHHDDGHDVGAFDGDDLDHDGFDGGDVDDMDGFDLWD